MPIVSREIRPLTSIRFFAAALVFCEHSQMLPGLHWMRVDSGWPAKVGVCVFFVLSGFILNYSYGHQNWTGNFGKYSREYFIGRAARIYPLHWLMFLIALPLGLNSITARVSVADFPWLLTLTDKFWPGCFVGFPPVKAAWTLSCEAVFYVLVPFILLFLQPRRRPLATSIGLVVGCSLAIPALIKFLPNLNWIGYAHLPEFFLGIVGYQWYRRMPESRSGNTLALGGLLWIAMWASVEGHLEIPYIYSLYGYAPGAMAMITGCAKLQGRIRGILSWPALVLLGNSSYAFYLFHDPLLRYTKVLLDRKGVVLPPPLNVLVLLLLFATCVGVSILCFMAYETPVRLRIRDWFNGGPKPAAVAASPTLS